MKTLRPFELSGFPIPLALVYLPTQVSALPRLHSRYGYVPRYLDRQMLLSSYMYLHTGDDSSTPSTTFSDWADNFRIIGVQIDCGAVSLRSHLTLGL